MTDDAITFRLNGIIALLLAVFALQLVTVFSGDVLIPAGVNALIIIGIPGLALATIYLLT
ncbi:hypothetical protein [Halopiger goleimassiliensis]|uniref:hypothetical protein n=1 Tax=Halopiger goleimassiliensis TaxID=1293048 RepID=UPI00067760F2|nr:hypothetical protein [Halopiger goleimassiliensis]